MDWINRWLGSWFIFVCWRNDEGHHGVGVTFMATFAQSLAAGAVGKEHVAGVDRVDVPLLGGVVEANIHGLDDVESPERAEGNRLGVEAVNGTAGLEAKGLAHGLCASFAEGLLVLAGSGFTWCFGVGERF